MAQITSLHLLLILLPTTLFTISHSNLSIKASLMYPFTCAQNSIQTCNASLYHISTGLKIEELATFYNTNTSQITPISHATTQDYLISVPCTCRDMNGTCGYFYDSTYNVSMGDTSTSVTDRIYNGQAWNGGDDGKFLVGNVVPIHLLCGCSNSPTVVTYTVQEQDTLAGIAELLSSSVDGIESLNGRMTQNPGFIDVGWVLFVPMKKVGVVTPKEGTRSNTPIIIGVVASVAVFLIGAGVAIVCFIRRNTSGQTAVQDPKIMGKTLSAKNMVSLHNQCLQRENMKDAAVFESERPVTFSLEEVEEATGNFHETRKIGEGGYGSVYFGILGAQELAIKKMKSSKSKEFFAELKVLCKVHHINVVELIGYACGDDHLYLVYEFVRYGSLNDHLHDPLLKGHQPLSWNARAQIALDAARGIEYIHDHTKAQYVHRDIKTSNILLDEGLRAKVGDFGLAKLVERSSEEDCFATRLVGTPGYLPPESVRELQMTSKTDVFAFGVVLAELITGQRALIRDNREPNRMKSLTSVVYEIFREEEPENALEAVIDGNLKDSYPMEELYKMAEIAGWCLNEEPVNRPEMRDIVVMLSQIVMASVEWEASLGGKSRVFSGILNGR